MNSDEKDMDMRLIDYKVNGAGWATLEMRATGNGKVETYGVSYLHDSLADLARMGLALHTGQSLASAVFMEEPGEVHLIAQGSGNVLQLELRGFEDWASWNMADASAYRVLFHGEIARADLVSDIQQVLARIYTEVGPARYRELWIEHEFPTPEYEQLTKALGLELAPTR